MYSLSPIFRKLSIKKVENFFLSYHNHKDDDGLCFSVSIIDQIKEEYKEILLNKVKIFFIFYFFNLD